MEFMNRGSRPSQPASVPAAPAAASGGHKRNNVSKGVKYAAVALLFSATILVVALIWSLVLGAPSSEGKHVDEKRMQAVFLNGGQVYFGRINDLNNDFMRVTDIYYLRVNQQVQPDQQQQNANANDISLVKLGCELHGPEDSMVINREQVVFWENLKDDGQVAKAVGEYKKANPNGQKCETPAANETPTVPANNRPADNEEEEE